MTFLTLINGQVEQTVPVTDRGLAYGDGLFETYRIVEGSIPLFDLHWQRLSLGARRLALPLPFDRESLLSSLLQTVPETGLAKLIITRGSGGRGYCPPVKTDVFWAIQGMALPETPLDLYQKGVKVRRCQLELSAQPILAGLKHLNRLEQVLARSEWQEPDIFDGLLFDQQGNLIESTVCNVFLLHKKQWITPMLDQCGVAGVMRAAIQDVCEQEGFSCIEQQITSELLLQSEALFLCNSVRGIISVRCWTDTGGDVLKTWSVLHPAVKKLISLVHPRLQLPVFN
jgi:4-amino-4-deoxychorismate lyase